MYALERRTVFRLRMKPSYGELFIRPDKHVVTDGAVPSSSVPMLNDRAVHQCVDQEVFQHAAASLTLRRVLDGSAASTGTCTWHHAGRMVPASLASNAEAGQSSSTEHATRDCAAGEAVAPGIIRCRRSSGATNSLDPDVALYMTRPRYGHARYRGRLSAS